ncbi:MAG: Acetyltransferase family [Marmoricola sp.]|nr:Acetyltransferase family [Marmoricola sp.]
MFIGGSTSEVFHFGPSAVEPEELEVASNHSSERAVASVRPMAEVEFTVEFEFALSDQDRGDVAALFPPHWRWAPEIEHRGWIQREPDFRVLGRLEGEIVASANVAELRKPIPRTLGIGDVVVSESLRGQGIGQRLMKATADACTGAGGDLTLLASQNVGVRKCFRAMGFVIPPPFGLYVRVGERWMWNESWLIRGGLPGWPVELESDI